MNVLFLVLGGDRRRAVLNEATDVVAAGGRARVLIGNPRSWRFETFPDGVERVEVAKLEARHLPLRIEDAVVFRAPRRIFRTMGHGPARKFAKRAGRAYENRVAHPLHNRFVRAYHRIWGDRQHELVMTTLLSGDDVDYLIVSDYLSMEWGARLQDALRAAGRQRPEVRFGVDHLVDAD